MWRLKLICAIFMVVHVNSDEENDNAQRRVFGGTYFRITDAPYMALLFHSIGHFTCGASIVHRQFLVSAAHCIKPQTHYYIKVGTDNLNGGEIYDIDNIIIHPQYKESKWSLINDVCVIKLKKKLSYNSRVNQISLAPRNFALQHGTVLETMGFGKSEMSKISRYLLRVTVPYVDVTTCSDILRSIRFTPSMMCAGGVVGEDACTGDSGGPLVYNNMLVGVVSFGYGENCGENFPAVYANISNTRDFIDRTIRVYSWLRWPWQWK